MIQYGLTSFGLRCGSNGVFRKPIPGVYTSIAYHRYWIDEQIERFKGSEPSTTTKGVTTEPGSTEPGSTKPGSTDLESCVKGCLKWNEQCATKQGLKFVKSLNLS